MLRYAVPMVLVFVLLLIMFWYMSLGVAVVRNIVKVDRADGPVEILNRGDKQWARLRPGAYVVTGDVVRTRAGARVILRWLDGTRLAMGENSEIVVVACDADEEKRISASRFSVTTGQVWFRVRNAYLDNPKSAFEVRTGHLSATVRGTVFSVTATEAESRVSVYEGRVHVVAAKKEVDLASGQVAEVAAKSPPNVAAFTPEERAAWAERSEVLQPTLGLTYPRKAVMTRNEVTGVTDPGCAVTVNGNAAPVDADGGFATRVPMQRGANTIEATATGADGLTYTVKEDVRYLPVKK